MPNSKIEQNYKHVKTCIRSKNTQVVSFFTLQAKCEIAAENADHTAQNYFSRKIQAKVKEHPFLKKEAESFSGMF